MNSNSGSYYISGCKNLRSNTNIPGLQGKSLDGMYFYIDYKNNKFFIRLDQTQNPNKIIEWQVGGTPTVVTKSASEISQYTKDIYFDRLNFSKQNTVFVKIENQGNLEYDVYENNRRIRKIENAGIFPNFEKNTPDYISENKEYYLEKKNLSILEISFTPTFFTEEV